MTLTVITNVDPQVFVLHFNALDDIFCQHLPLMQLAVLTACAEHGCANEIALTIPP